MAYKNNAKFGFQGFTMPAPRELSPFEKIKWQMEQAKEMAKWVTGPKIFADVRAEKGPDGKYRPSVTMEELTELGFVMCSTHFTLKAAMEGMLEHGL